MVSFIWQSGSLLFGNPGLFYLAIRLIRTWPAKSSGIMYEKVITNSMELSSESLAEYTKQISIDDLPEEVEEQVERLTLDTIGCALGAFNSPPSKKIRQVYDNRDSGGSESTIFGSGKNVDVEYGALINGIMGRYLDFNDCYTTQSAACHPSDHIPALVSVAEAEQASGADLIESVVIAYEIQCRGVDTGIVTAEGFDYSTWAAYSSVAAVGKLMDLDKDQLINAFGIAGSNNNGLLIARLGTVSMYKGMAVPYVTHNAIQACQMARNGITGPKQVFEGDRGFFEVVSKEPVSLEDLGGRNGVEDYRVMETSFKTFACGFYTHPSVTAALDIVRENNIDPNDIEKIEVETFTQAVEGYASGPEKWARDMNRETADHSLPYNVSVAIIDDEVTPEQYNEEHLQDEQIYQMMQKVSVQADEDLDQYRMENPSHMPSKVAIEASGEKHRKRVNYPKGHPERPMTNDELRSKAEDLMDPYLSGQQIETLAENCFNLKSENSINNIINSLKI